jgi:lambda family phage portal protein
MNSTLDYLLKAQNGNDSPWDNQGVPLYGPSLYPSRWLDTAHSGASLSRKQLANWVPSRMPADVDLLPDLPTLVGRARDLNRNNGIAAGGLQTIQDNVAGVGLRLSPWPDWKALGKTMEWADQWSQKVAALWRSWADSGACDITGQLNFNAMTQLIFRSTLENGEALALVMWTERPNTTFQTSFQLVESDRISNPYNTPPRMNLVGGVEKDDYGKPIAYWIRRAPLWLNGWLVMPMAQQWDRIPTETEWGRKRLLHPHVKNRIEQTRGRPLLTPVIEQFRMVDSYQRTELQSAIVNALVAGVIETPLDPASIAEMVGGDANAYLQTKNEYRVQLEGGSMIPLYPGDKMQPFVPARPAVQFPAFVEAVLRQIGTALGLPYELLLKDFSKTNYSSARAALLEAWKFFTVRRNWLADNWANPVYRLWLEEAVNTGQVDGADDFYENYAYYTRAKWIGMGRGWVDPVKEAEAAQIRMDAMVSTLEVECAEQGLDWNEVLEQRALEKSRMTQLGLEPAVLALPPLTKEKTEEGQPLPPEEAGTSPGAVPDEEDDTGKAAPSNAPATQPPGKSQPTSKQPNPPSPKAPPNPKARARAKAKERMAA